MATLVQWNPPPTATTCTSLLLRNAPRRRRRVAAVSARAFGRADFDGFVRHAWQGANAGAERLAFEARRAAQRLDGRFELSRRLSQAARAVEARAREIDAEMGIGRRWRSFSVDFSRNFPRYRRQLSDFMRTPIGRGLVTLFFFWFALSGWLFRVLIFTSFVLPFAAPLLLGMFANRVAIEGTCPACKTRFVGYRNQVIRCRSCRNIVWQPSSSSFGGGGRTRNSDPDIIDVEFEEKK